MQVQPFGFPRVYLTERGTKHPPRQGSDETRFFSERDEAVRWDESVLRMMPAYQRFHCSNAAARTFHNWLVVQHQLVTIDGIPQGAHEHESLRCGLLSVVRGEPKA